MHLSKETPKNAKLFGSFYRIKALERIKWDLARKATLSLTCQNSTLNSSFPQSFWCLSAVGRTMKDSSGSLNICNKVSVRTGIPELENLISIKNKLSLTPHIKDYEEQKQAKGTRLRKLN